jgi:hypothetical protein
VVVSAGVDSRIFGYQGQDQDHDVIFGQGSSPFGDTLLPKIGYSGPSHLGPRPRVKITSP